MPARPSSPEAALPPIYTLRKQKVVLDSDLAHLFGTETRVFNQAIRRNEGRFPADFAFQLILEETESLKTQQAKAAAADSPPLRSQTVTLKRDPEKDRRGRHRKYLPWVFTEHGAIMAAMVLRSDHAVAMSLYVVRAFVRIREELTANLSVLRRLAEIDRKLLEHDAVLREVIARLQPLLDPDEATTDPSPKRKIGFHEGNR